MLLHDFDGQGIRGGIGAQLEEEALGHRARGHPGGIEALDEGQDLLDFIRRDPAAEGDLVQFRAEVAVLVDVADDLGPDAPHRLIFRGEAQLLVEVSASDELLRAMFSGRSSCSSWATNERSGPVASPQ
jgi:hypothetical protein